MTSICPAFLLQEDQIEYSNWNLQPLPEAHGGGAIVLIGDAMSEAFHRRLSATAKEDGNRPIDMLSCVPPSWVHKNSDGKKW